MSEYEIDDPFDESLTEVEASEDNLFLGIFIAFLFNNLGFKFEDIQGLPQPEFLEAVNPVIQFGRTLGIEIPPELLRYSASDFFAAGAITFLILAPIYLFPERLSGMAPSIKNIGPREASAFSLGCLISYEIVKSTGLLPNPVPVDPVDISAYGFGAVSYYLAYLGSNKIYQKLVEPIDNYFKDKGIDLEA